MKPNMEKIIQVLISLIGEQEKVKIDYTLEKKAEDKTAQADKEVDKPRPIKNISVINATKTEVRKGE